MSDSIIEVFTTPARIVEVPTGSQGAPGVVDEEAVQGAVGDYLTANPITKSSVGLGNVDNTADNAKPVSTAQATALAAKSDTGHGHAQSDVTGLTAALSGKAATAHTHAIADTTGLQTALDAKQAAGSYAAATHTHAQSEVTGLTTALSGKAATSHTHAIADTTGLQTALDGKQAAGSYAAASHSHAQSDVTNLTSDLAAKAPLASPAFTGTPTGITKSHVGLGNVDNTSDANKPVSTAQQSALDGKSSSGHTHAYSALTGIPSTFTPATHSHTVSDVTGFDEQVRDVMGVALVAGANVTITPNDGADTITIAASGGGGGGGITTEDAQDTVAAMIATTGNLSKTYDDTGNTLTLDVPQGIPAVSSEPAGPVGLVWAKDLGGGAYSLMIKTS